MGPKMPPTMALTVLLVLFVLSEKNSKYISFFLTVDFQDNTYPYIFHTCFSNLREQRNNNINKSNCVISFIFIVSEQTSQQKVRTGHKETNGAADIPFKKKKYLLDPLIHFSVSFSVATVENYVILF